MSREVATVATDTKLNADAKQSLRLPAAFGDAANLTALDIDAFLQQDGRRLDTLNDKVEAYRKAGLSHLLTLSGKQTIDIDTGFFPVILGAFRTLRSLRWFNLFRWPASLFIPGAANASDYWFTSNAPDDHRYGLDWTAPATATANRASRQDGTLFAFSQLLNESAKSPQSSESGLGIFYKPSMNLGAIDLQPHVDCSGTLRTLLEFFPTLAAGYVEVKAELLLASWQQIPGGFDLIGFKSFEVASSGQRDQSFGAQLLNFQRSFAGANLSAPFVVQHGRTYLLGVVGRISVMSTLTSNTGAPFPPVSSSVLKVWGSMNCVVPQIDVVIKRVDIP
jgi:hypothetical protein